MLLFRQFALLLIVFGLFLTGCGSKYHPVTGEIVFPDGTPAKGLSGGQIVFQKVGSDGESAATNSASGPIDADGKFALGTDATADGAPEGEYRAIISPPQPSGDEQIPKVIDVKFTRPNNTTPVYTVKKGVNHIKVTVDPVK